MCPLARDAGWRSQVVTTATAQHVGGGSGATSAGVVFEHFNRGAERFIERRSRPPRPDFASCGAARRIAPADPAPRGAAGPAGRVGYPNTDRPPDLAGSDPVGRTASEARRAIRSGRTQRGPHRVHRGHAGWLRRPAEAATSAPRRRHFVDAVRKLSRATVAVRWNSPDVGRVVAAFDAVLMCVMHEVVQQPVRSSSNDRESRRVRTGPGGSSRRSREWYVDALVSSCTPAARLEGVGATVSVVAMSQ